MIKQILRSEINSILLTWLKNKGVDSLPSYSLEEPPKNIKCDLALNIAMLLAKQLKANPRMIAEELIKLLTEKLSLYIKNIEIAGAGFLNIYLADNFLYTQINSILKEKNNFGEITKNKNEKILIEFVSANPTGPLHIGHGRGAAIGDSLARIFAYAGYQVEREYYINDVGNQMNILGDSLKIRYQQQKGSNIEFPENGYQGDYIIDIAKKLIDSNIPEDKINFKNTALTEMMSTIEKDLEEFNIKFDTWFSEAKIALPQNDQESKSEVDKTCDFLLKKNLAYTQDGALWFASTKYNDDKDRVLRRNDGRYTYLASDIAYHKNKIDRGYNRLIDLWGADHHGYVARMKAAIESLGSDPEILTIILYQLVSLSRNGVPVVMSTRSGEFITLTEVIKEVGKDACRFFFMLRAPDSQLEFDLELAKKHSSENPVFYVQYVHARCCSIFKEFKNRYNTDFTYDNINLYLLINDDERNLIKKLAIFPDILELCINSLSPHHLTIYLLETADLFHKFYEKCRVLSDDKELTNSRLALVKSTAIIIKNGLNLLGVSAPEKM